MGIPPAPRAPESSLDMTCTAWGSPYTVHLHIRTSWSLAGVAASVAALPAMGSGLHSLPHSARIKGLPRCKPPLQTPTKTVGFRLQIRNPVGNFLLNFYWSMFALVHCGILCSPQSESPYLCKRMKLEQSLNTIYKNKLQMD